MKKRSMFIICAIVILVCLTSSCSSTSRVSVTEDLRLDLLPLEAIRERIDVYQLMTGTIPGYGDAVLESYLVADDKGIEMYLFAPTGQTIATVRYDGLKASMDSEFIPHGEIASSYMVFDIQMCYADARDIEKSGLVVEERIVEGKRIRSLSYEGTSLYEISYMGNLVTVDNVYRGYSYTLETLY